MPRKIFNSLLETEKHMGNCCRITFKDKTSCLTFSIQISFNADANKNRGD